MAPSAAATAAGLPPYVPPRPPPPTASMISARPVTAASGNPPAMPFAVVTMSGTMPSCSDANILPVRAKPACTSSATKTMPFSRAYSTSAGRKPSAGTMKPPSPWIGSMTIAATSSAPTCLSIMLITRCAASSPDTFVPAAASSRYGYDMGAR